MIRPATVSACLVVLALASCRSAVVEPPLLSDSAVMLDLPLVRQDEMYNCGLAAISALCQYWDVSIPGDQRTELARLAKEERGLSGGELRDALVKDGMEVFLFRGTLDRSETGLFRHLDAGRPLLVMLSPDGRGEKGHHYCLVLGYDEPRKNLVLLDPARGEVLRPCSVFEHMWESCRNFTLLATPKNGDERLPTGPAGDYRAGTPRKEN